MVGWVIALICPVAKSALLLPGSRTVGEKTAFAASRPIDLKDYSEAYPRCRYAWNSRSKQPAFRQIQPPAAQGNPVSNHYYVCFECRTAFRRETARCLQAVADIQKEINRFHGFTER